MKIVSPLYSVGIQHEILLLPLGEDAGAHLGSIALQHEITMGTEIWVVPLTMEEEREQERDQYTAVKWVTEAVALVGLHRRVYRVLLTNSEFWWVNRVLIMEF